MKNIFVIAILLLTSVSQADIIKCDFTEPFFTTEYSMTQSTLTYIDIDFDGSGPKTKVYKNVSFQIKDAGVFDLVAKNGEVLQTLKLNYDGSNGMSDETYPYDVADFGQAGTTEVGFHGGCESNYLKSKYIEP